MSRDLDLCYCGHPKALHPPAWDEWCFVSWVAGQSPEGFDVRESCGCQGYERAGWVQRRVLWFRWVKGGRQTLEPVRDVAIPGYRSVIDRTVHWTRGWLVSAP